MGVAAQPLILGARSLWAQERFEQEEGKGDMDDGHAATREQIRLRAEEAGLGRVAEAMADLARPGLRLVAKDASRRAPDPAGEGFGEYPLLPEILKASGEARASTRLGGVPLVGEGFS